MALGGILLKSNSTLIRILQFLISIFILGTFSYYIGILRKYNDPIAIWIRAVEGIAGSAVIYTLFAILLTFFIGGVMFFAFLGLLLDVLFMGAFIGVAVLTRDGAYSCSGTVYTPLGSGKVSGRGIGNSDLKRICKLEKAIFAVAVANAVLFLLAAILQLFLGKHHQREKRYGPSPSNNYTSGEGKRPFWKRRKGETTDAELGTVGAAGMASEKQHHKNNTIRPSHETGMTGSTVAPADATHSAFNHKHEPTVPIIYDPEPSATVHHPGYPHVEAPGHSPTPVDLGTNNGYAGDGYGRNTHGHTNF